ncbi:hypothetical protein FACS1894184_19530 [Clostridia bacterium]|nr:hypothetical protein FACS1894184_19530 [Clostridia bacterium]
MSIINSILSRIITPNTHSNEAFLKYLRNHGVVIGKNTRFIYPRKCHIDIHRAKYITIGDNCCLSQVKILAHDYSWYVLKEVYDDILPDPGGAVKIGNNCFIGYETCILKGTNIGDNVIIGARSVVKGSIPSNSVWAGIPAKQISTLEDYYKKKKSEELTSLALQKSKLEERNNNTIDIPSYGWFALYFLQRSAENYNKYIKHLAFNGITDDERIRKFFFATNPIFNGYQDFLEKIDKLLLN